MARIQVELGNNEASRAANQEAIRLFEQLREQSQASVDLQAGLASAYFFAGRYDDTVKLCQTILQAEPGHAETRSLLAETYNTLAVGDKNKSDIEAALKYHRQAFELREALVRDFPENPRVSGPTGGHGEQPGRTCWASKGSRRKPW